MKSNKKNLNVVMLDAVITVVALACFLTGSKPIVIAFSILYSILILFGLVGVIALFTDTTGTGIRMAKVVREGKPTVDPDLWDKHVEEYRSRLKSGLFWLSLLIAAVMLTLLWVKASYILFTAVLVGGILAEVAKYRLYRRIRDKKTIWGAAMFIREVQDMVGSVSKERDNGTG